MKQCTAVIVTHNRSKLLNQCIRSIVNQNIHEYQQKFNKNIVIVDNSDPCSIKQNQEVIQRFIDIKEINQINHIINNTDEKNAATGFYIGIRDAINHNYGYNDNLIWIMDDDTIPENDSLYYLIKAFEQNQCSFVSSFVNFRDTGKPFYKNIPRNAKTNEQLFNEQGKDELVKINFGTFTSLLTSQGMIMDAGLPQKEFYIWGDDTEFSERLIYSNQNKKGLLVCNSIVDHMTKVNDKTIWELYPINDTRYERFYYGFRNRIVASRRRGNEHSLQSTIKHEVNEIINGIINIEEDNSISREKKDELIKDIKEYPVKGLIDGIDWFPKIHRI